MRASNAFAKVLGAALLAGAVVSSAYAADAGAASESTWFAPLAAMTAPGALTPKSAASVAPRPIQSKMLLMKGVQMTHGRSKAPFGATAVPSLQYFGGPLLGNVKVQLVFWNNAVAYQDRLPGFYSAITQSPYFDWLSEYNSPSVSVGRGSYVGAYVDNAVGSGQIEDADIQTELSRLLSQKALPQPDANTLYMVYFPPGLNIDMGGSGSCQVFCAYHSAYMSNGTEINYGVIPDQGGSCSGGCGGNSDQFNNETSVSSHEMIEAVTDPAVGLVTGNTPQAPLGWYDATYGEIGDICNAVQGQVGDYTVQRVWSNSRGLCIDAATDSGAPFVPVQSSDSGNGGSIAGRP